MIRFRRRRTTLLSVMLGLGVLGAGTGDDSPAPTYRVLYDVRIIPSQRAAEIEIRVEQSRGLLREIGFPIDSNRIQGFEGSGEIEVTDDNLSWRVPEAGGSLRYTVQIDHLRDPAEYDARCTERWALFRGTDLIPPTRTVSRSRARSEARIRFRLPPSWQIVTPFEEIEPRLFRIDHPQRRFDAPRGWMIAGELHIVDGRIGDTRIVLAGPEDHDVHARDRLALLRWTLPEIERVVERMPDRLVVVSAEAPMWRGGLSGPDSLYLHGDRPLIDRDGTSPLLHEVMHVLMGVVPGEHGDWIIEGLAELYSIELLRRSGGIVDEEAAATLARMRKRADRAESLEVRDADGAVLRRAIVVLRALDERIQEMTEGKASLDQVLRRIAGASDPVTPELLQREAEAVAGGSLEEFFARRVQ